MNGGKSAGKGNVIAVIAVIAAVAVVRASTATRPLRRSRTTNANSPKPSTSQHWPWRTCTTPPTKTTGRFVCDSSQTSCFSRARPLKKSPT
jgi:hypothetical protein